MSLEIQKPAALIERLAAAVCRHPDKLKMNLDVGNSMVRIQFTAANATDSKRLVGGRFLSSLKLLASLMFKRTDKVVEFDWVQCDSESEDAHLGFKPDENWPRAKLESLLLEVAATSFPERKVEVKTRDTARNNHGTQFHVVMDSIDDSDSIKFGKAIATLFVPIGENNGRRIWADIRRR